MRSLLIYEAEARDGLTELIEKNSSIAYICKLEPCEEKYRKVIKQSSASEKEDEDEEDEDILYYTKSVLVTTNWNKNDDVFLRGEVWAARHTPIHKPTNIDHNRREIVGHITDTWAIDFDGNIIAESTVPEELPDFHLCNAAVIYRYYSKEEDLQERAEKLIEEIEAGNKYVSMECLFPSFDYALKSESGLKIVRRNADSAFLTKHLRAYGGTGQYGEYTIGRVLRNIEFSGKGYVDKPANPDSIIFGPTEKATAEIIEIDLAELQLVKEESIGNNIDNNTDGDNLMENSKELDQAKETIATLQKQVKDLTDQMAAISAEKFETQIEDLKASVAKSEADKEALSSKVNELTESLTAKTNELEEVSKAKAEAEQKIAEAEAEALKASRVSSLVDGGLEKETAESNVAKFSGLNDEQFEEVAKALIAASKKVEKEDTTVEDVSKQITDATVKEEVVIPSENTSEAAEKLTSSLASLFTDMLKVEANK